ncbi:hypothetical protein SERLA73DRAFT_179517 [Serpula lacrymans var. lacrymans S7.3]|uniref:Uncharacterized protein n=2 Tax=Serpula lacrymans var. lacrymans TaxID=341189 RepID=F8PSR7_SERL3|nr:uncharacterized protein SERLADRAFT_464689 [Serpula lacrymans var. lacrymans S7.9]EGO01345.1 hypothetical protein SERLA73DRAFT_179517 [Serpula lacrymans var. lacrymans S7.3]EGO26985.1 hypothetical protein SERLADRAFT_464689 [Serpula lacrymans var. lacrymans S7.9]
MLLASFQAEFGLGVVSYSAIYKHTLVTALGSYSDQLSLSHPRRQSSVSTDTYNGHELAFAQAALNKVLRIRGLTNDDVEDALPHIESIPVVRGP